MFTDRLVTFETAKLLKEANYDGGTQVYYDSEGNGISRCNRERYQTFLELYY